MIEVSEVTKDFGYVHALRKVDLKIKTGEFVTVVGPSGCGKSTLLRIIAGLVTPSDGKIIKTGCGELAEELEKTGYTKLS